MPETLGNALDTTCSDWTGVGLGSVSNRMNSTTDWLREFDSDCSGSRVVLGIAFCQEDCL